MSSDNFSTIPARFRQIVHTGADNVAVINSDFTSFTYGQLAHMADSIRAIFPVMPKRVGILCGHGASQFAAIMAVIASGGAYVAVEPSLPGVRIRRIFREAEVDFVLTGVANMERVADFNPIRLPREAELLAMPIAAPPSVEVLPDTPAYILYTAGRSGKRKGVIVENENVANYVRAFKHEFEIGPGDVMLQSSVATYDSFVEEVFVTLLNGAALAVLPENARGDIHSIADFAERTGVTIVNAFTPLVGAANALRRIPPRVRLIIANGDVLAPGHISWLKDQGPAIYFSYMLSETTVRAAWMRCNDYELAPGATAYPIGRPIDGVEIAILNENLEPVEPFMPGEICILGDGVARGYVNYRDDTASFATMPDGRRVYLTGDMGTTDGHLFYFLGHSNNKVVIEGRDVDYREVESALRQDPNIENGAVCSFTDSDGKPYLVAYFTSKRSAPVSLTALRRHMKSLLAWFKVPEFYVQMQSLPRKRNGRISIKDLPQIFKK